MDNDVALWHLSPSKYSILVSLHFAKTGTRHLDVPIFADYKGFMPIMRDVIMASKILARMG